MHSYGNASFNYDMHIMKQLGKSAADTATIIMAADSIKF